MTPPAHQMVDRNAWIGRPCALLGLLCRVERLESDQCAGIPLGSVVARMRLPPPAPKPVGLLPNEDNVQAWTVHDRRLGDRPPLTQLGASESGRVSPSDIGACGDVAASGSSG